MTESMQWRVPKPGPGRLYQNAEDQHIKYDDAAALQQNIKDSLKVFLKFETSVRLLLDGDGVNPTTSVISVPFEGDEDRLYENMATLVREQLWGYYLSTDPKTIHYGLTNLVYDGNETNLIRRETEKFLHMLQYRHDLAGRAMRDYHMACEMAPFQRDNYMSRATEKVLDIQLGVRMYNWGEGVQRTTIFLPIPAGREAIERIYYNIEHIIHQNLVAYDELHDHYLPVSEELVLRELEQVLVRARHKGNTRKKIINGLTMHTVLMEDPTMVHHISLADLYYDKINRIDLLDEAAARSRDMLNGALIRSAEMANAVTSVEDLKLEERVYIERSQAVDTEAVTMPRGSVAQQGRAEQAQQQAAPQPQPAQQPQQQEEEKREPVTVQKDGLEEL